MGHPDPGILQAYSLRHTGKSMGYSLAQLRNYLDGDTEEAVVTPYDVIEEQAFLAMERKLEDAARKRQEASSQARGGFRRR